MIDSLNQFATWLFTALTSIWNFAINSPLLKWLLGIYILNLIYEEFKKYLGK